MTKTAPPDNGNFASLVFAQASAHPEKLALVMPKTWDETGLHESEELTYGQLIQRTRAMMAGLRHEGFQPGDRMVIAFPLSTDSYAFLWALFALGVTAVLIDPGMGPQKVKEALDTANAKGIVGTGASLKLLYRALAPPLRRIPKKYTRDTGWFVKHFSTLVQEPDQAPEVVPRSPSDECMITFTSGSTGRPKGANRTHGLLRAQHEALKAEYPPQNGQVDMPCFPNVATHNLCCGITTVLPAVDFAKPAEVAPRPVVQQMEQYGVSSMTGAPAYMGRIASYMMENGIQNSQVKRTGVGGAPVSAELCQQLLAVFPGVEGYVIYGSTEAEPMTNARLEEACETRQEGYLVGSPIPAIDLALLNLPAEPPTLDHTSVGPYRVAAGETGEIVVRGAHVNPGYIENEAANRENKLYEPDGSVWHRTGDLGFFDSAGRLWLVGRLKDVVRYQGRLVQPYPIEAILEGVDGIERAAVITSENTPDGIVVLQSTETASDKQVVAKAHEVLAAQDLAEMPTCTIAIVPVDGRHNSKIDRPRLRKQVEQNFQPGATRI
ncbi:MAG: AMP-binding protein [Myxococcota bacterium]|nr:AMP-binding protein [Myxococcota bacterium]